MRYVSAFAAAALVTIAGATLPAQPGAGWVSLFDGKTLDGWKVGENAASFSVADGAIVGGDGRHRVDDAGADRLSAPGRDVDYRLTRAGARRLEPLGIESPDPGRDGMPLRYCVDWTEQAHHLSGPLGRDLARRLLDLGWLRRADRGRRPVHRQAIGVGHRQRLPEGTRPSRRGTARERR